MMKDTEINDGGAVSQDGLARAGRGADQFTLRFPDGMRDRIKIAADVNGRSMNTEIVLALAAHFEGNGSAATDGMSLRDYFAGRAPFTLDDAAYAVGIPKYREVISFGTDEFEGLFEVLAAMRYAYADAMLAARSPNCTPD